MFDYARKTYSKEAESIDALKSLYGASGFGRFKITDIDDGDVFIPSMDYF